MGKFWHSCPPPGRYLSALRDGAAALRVLVSTLILLFCATPAIANELVEYQLKAAFLYNFAAYTDWPPAVGSVLNLCIYGHDPFGAEIDGLNGKVVGNRKLVVARKTSLESLKGCQIVFIPSTDIGQLPRLLDTLRGLPVLTITENPGAVHQGAALNMNLAQKRITFEANLAAARGAGLNLSSKMLRLATEVVQ